MFNKNPWMKRLILPAAITASLALASCGGGGGGTGQPDPGNGIAAGTANLSGQLLQGSDVKVSSTIGAGLPGILVKLIRSSNGQLLGTDTTDGSGHYEFKGVPSGTGYLLKLEFLSSQDLNGDGSPDELELYFPLNLADQSTTQLLQRIGVSDSDSDGELDAVEVEFHFSDDFGHEDEHHSQHRHRSGETWIDDDGDGSYDDSYDDSDADGLPDDSSGGSGMIHEIEVHGLVSALTSSSITVNGTSFALSGGTEWRIGDDRSADPGQFSVGSSVEVEGHSNGSGGWIASKVQMDDNGSDGSAGDDSGSDDSGSDDSGSDDSSSDDSGDDSSDDD